MGVAPRVFYNEIDPFAASWLRSLIAAGSLPAGDVDERDIRDVRPGDLDGYAACHFFAGIGGWPLALRLAGLPDDAPVWTGSCPCQPFSAAGRRGGIADERHLWPHWHHLIRECRPATVFGEQVEAAVRLGWLDLVQADLEGEGYAFGAAVLGAHSVGAPHIRQRLWWVAHTPQERRSLWHVRSGATDDEPGPRSSPERCGAYSELVDSLGSRLDGRDARALGNEREAAERGGEAGTMGDANGCGMQGSARGFPQGARVVSERGFWADLEWLPCRDGRARPTQPGLQLLAHGIPGRVGLLRGIGNAIVPQAAAEFVRAFL